MPNQFQALFAESFDTFKVWNTLTIREIDNPPVNAPKSIWQILNHLISWQSHQLNQLSNTDSVFQIDEKATWKVDTNAATQVELDAAIALFNQQLADITAEIRKFDISDGDIFIKLKLVQDLSVHLSFHVGELILMRRMAGKYPLPHQMEDFLGE
jgi:Cu/Ag efflux protein CusF